MARTKAAANQKTGSARTGAKRKDKNKKNSKTVVKKAHRYRPGTGK